MQCCVESIKCCTDRLVCAVNCIGIPASTTLIVCKNYDVIYTDNINWGYTILPAASLVFVNLTYFMCCLAIKKSIKNKPAFDTDCGAELP